uniref:Uncharacterized protein n=1 Tax=Davidia involucrata TaxID=16924 RepID=A0A5B7BW69_DAVIN
MTSGGVGTKNPIDEDRRIQSVTHSGSRIQENREDNRLCTDDGARSQPVRGHVSVRKALRNYERLPEFDGMFYFEDFLDWIYDLDNCFEYMRLSKGKKYMWAEDKLIK